MTTPTATPGPTGHPTRRMTTLTAVAALADRPTPRTTPLTTTPLPPSHPTPRPGGRPRARFAPLKRRIGAAA
ncbi:hypothetical protein ACWD1Z_10035 [Streptomyces sp. NPDC002784]